jgi:hypothetical protein
MPEIKITGNTQHIVPLSHGLKFAGIYICRDADGKFIDSGYIDFYKTLKESKAEVMRRALVVMSVNPNRVVRNIQYMDYYGNRVMIKLKDQNFLTDNASSYTTYYNGSIEQMLKLLEEADPETNGGNEYEKTAG